MVEQKHPRAIPCRIKLASALDRAAESDIDADQHAEDDRGHKADQTQQPDLVWS